MKDVSDHVRRLKEQQAEHRFHCRELSREMRKEKREGRDAEWKLLKRQHGKLLSKIAILRDTIIDLQRDEYAVKYAWLRQ